jgi:hypothetical protein
MFQTMTGSGSVNILVCTHNDADHANGVIGFLESGLECEEIWLPGRWLNALSGVLRPFTDVFVRLAEEVAQENLAEDLEHQPWEGKTPLEQLAERLPDRLQDRETDDGTPLGEDGWPESLREGLERAESWDSSAGWPWLVDPRLWLQIVHAFPPYASIGPARTRLLWSVIEAARKIRAIAIAAFHCGIPVRWFEYDCNRPGGGCAQLEPLNARAIARFRPFTGLLLHFLALTVSNKESLVFWSPGTDDFPGVLFTADSDLNNVQLPRDIAGAIATAPHHGSEANANAYAAVAAACDAASLKWVRSDGRYRSRPGLSYLKVAGRRLCTLCRLPGGRSSTKRPVHLFSRQGGWIRHRTTAKCACV